MKKSKKLKRRKKPKGISYKSKAECNSIFNQNHKYKHILFSKDILPLIIIYFDNKKDRKNNRKNIMRTCKFWLHTVRITIYKGVSMCYHSKIGNEIVVKQLLEYNINVYDEKSLGICFAADVAAKNGRTGVLKLLFDDEKERSSSHKGVSLTSACMNGHLEAAKEILKRMENFELYKGCLQNSFIISCSYGNIKMVKELLNRGVDPSYSDYPIINASTYGHVKVVKELLKDKRVDPTVMENEALIQAMKNDHFKVAKVLLRDQRVDPISSTDIFLPLVDYWSVYKKTVKFLIDNKRIDVVNNGNWLINIACDRGNLDMIKFLMEYPTIDPSGNHNYNLVFVCGKLAVYENNRILIVKQLLKDHRVNPFIGYFENSFTTACIYGHINIIKEFLRDPRAESYIGMNSILRDCEIAIRGFHFEIIWLLIRDERMKLSPNFGKIFCIACGYKLVSIVREILKGDIITPECAREGYDIAIENEGWNISDLLLADGRMKLISSWI